MDGIWITLISLAVFGLLILIQLNLIFYRMRPSLYKNFGAIKRLLPIGRSLFIAVQTLFLPGPDFP